LPRNELAVPLVKIVSGLTMSQLSRAPPAKSLTDHGETPTVGGAPPVAGSLAAALSEFDSLSGGIREHHAAPVRASRPMARRSSAAEAITREICDKTAPMQFSDIKPALRSSDTRDGVTR
jgi:hypothetical protein